MKISPIKRKEPKLVKREKNSSLRIKGQDSGAISKKKKERETEVEEGGRRCQGENKLSWKVQELEVGEPGKGGMTEGRSEVANKGNFASSMPLSYQ